MLLALPNELQVQILCELEFADLLALRLTNTILYSLIHQNESPIVRHLIKHKTPELLSSLWPPPQRPESASFSYYLGLAHRLVVVRDLATHIADFIMIKLLSKTTKSQQEGFCLQHQRMNSRCQPLILILYHFFESYRNNLLAPFSNKASRVENPGPPYSSILYQIGGPQEIEKGIINGYNPEQLLHVHLMYQLLLSALKCKLRPPSYAGRLERTLRGWRKTPASEGDIVKVLLLGGIEEVNRLIEIKTYSARRKALDEFIGGLTSPKQDDSASSTDVVTAPPIALSSNPAVVANSFERFFTAFLDEEVLSHITMSHCRLREIWTQTAMTTLLEKNVISGELDIPPTREFIGSLTQEQ